MSPVGNQRILRPLEKSSLSWSECSVGTKGQGMRSCKDYPRQRVLTLLSADYLVALSWGVYRLSVGTVFGPPTYPPIS